MLTLLYFTILFAVSTSLHWKHSNLSLPITLSKAAFGTGTDQKYLYIFGGRETSNDKTDNVYKWWIASNNTAVWSVINNLSSKSMCGGQCSVTINESIYILGLEENKIYVFNTTNDKWNNITISLPPHNAIYSSCITHNNSHIFMIGGIINGVAVNYFQVYNITNNSWIQLEPIPFDNWFGGSCIYYSKTNTIYVFGGSMMVGRFQPSTNNIWMYDMSQNRWNQSIYNLSVARSGSSTIVIDNKMYVIGGFYTDDGSDYTLSTVDIYNPSDDTIQHSASSNLLKKRGFSMVIINKSRIYVMGGEYDIYNAVDQMLQTIEVSDTINSKHRINYETIIIIGASAVCLVILMCGLCIGLYLNYKDHNKEPLIERVGINNDNDIGNDNGNKKRSIEEQKEGEKNVFVPDTDYVK